MQGTVIEDSNLLLLLVTHLKLIAVSCGSCIKVRYFMDLSELGTSDFFTGRTIWIWRIGRIQSGGLHVTVGPSEESPSAVEGAYHKYDWRKYQLFTTGRPWSVWHWQTFYVCSNFGIYLLFPLKLSNMLIRLYIACQDMVGAKSEL